MARRRVRGNFRSLIKRLPDSVAEEFRAQLDKTGRQVLSRARQRGPVDTGALKSGLSYKVLPKSLKLKVGLIGKPTNRKLFYGRIVEFGRKAKRVAVNRSGRGIRLSGNRFKRQAIAKGVKGFYYLNVRAMAPRHFVYATPRDAIYRPYQKLWGAAIHRAAQGATDE
jgi:hypothetical protein